MRIDALKHRADEYRFQSPDGYSVDFYLLREWLDYGALRGVSIP
jgi:hypothetical protein